MNANTSKHIVLTAATASLLLVALLLLLNGAPRVVRADPDDLFVSPGGGGSSCSRSKPCALETALSQSLEGDTLYLAGGRYTGDGDAVISLIDTIHLRGGWDGASGGPVERDPWAHPTTLDGENQRRVVTIDGDIRPSLDGFIITGGNASHGPDAGRGGGIYSKGASPLVTNNVITHNVAYTSTATGHGGGVYLIGASSSTLIRGNVIISNVSSTAAQGRGGGLTAYASAATITGNTFQSNVAGFTSNSQGGGLYLGSSSATVSANLIRDNKATPTGEGFGGGFHTQFGDIALNGNGVFSNASSFGSVTFDSNAGITMTNNIVAQNVGGVFVTGNATFPFAGALVHNTIAENGSEGVYVGWYSSGYSSLTLINNIIVSHTSGIYVYDEPTNLVTATHTLFYGNDADTQGRPIASTHEITGSAPRFASPAAWNYHLRGGSPAIDAGTPVPWLTSDIDGDPRPIHTYYDIGADEYPWLIHLPIVARNAHP